MILPGQTIRKLCVNEPYMIKPFSEREKVHGMSYGLSFAGYDIRLGESVRIYPGYTTVAPSLEEFNMPYDLLANVADKSTLARRGIQVKNTIIEPGWRGTLAIEITYEPLAKEMIPKAEFSFEDLQAGSPIAQIIFHRLEDLPESSYYGKYQGQTADDIGAKFDD
jgi:dCTP deaminase